jgi:UDPglucose 6-dehydrogenase
MKVTVIGAGYVGLVSAAGFAELGNDVVCADIDPRRIEKLYRGEIPIVEPGLDELVNRNAGAGRLRFTTEIKEAVARAAVTFLAVGTPSRGDGAADLSSIIECAEMVAANVRQEAVLVLKSTVPVGTNARVRRIVQTAPHMIHVVSNPEFLKEGDAVLDFLRPERIVIGCEPGDGLARRVMRRLYAPLHLDRDRVLFMDPPSAELTKYVSNTMLAMRISFMNEIASLCEQVGADAHSVRLGVGSDSRIGAKFLYAGPGYGGSCFPKDVQALLETGREYGLELELASATHRVNERQKGTLLRKLRRHFDTDLRGKHIGVWGIAFKPRTDDIRQSPALTLIDGLLSEGARVAAHDPHARDAARGHYEDRIQIVEDAYDAAANADALVLVTECQEYRSPDFERLKRLMRGQLLLDGRNVWSSYGLCELGFRYEGIGTRSQ